jgi:hypothetical protein
LGKQWADKKIGLDDLKALAEIRDTAQFASCTNRSRLEADPATDILRDHCPTHSFGDGTGRIYGGQGAGAVAVVFPFAVVVKR